MIVTGNYKNVVALMDLVYINKTLGEIYQGFFISNINRYFFLSKIFHQYLCITTITQFGYALFSYLTYTFTCKS